MNFLLDHDVPRHLLRLIDLAGEAGVAGNINFA